MGGVYSQETFRLTQQRGRDTCPSSSVPAGEIERFIVDQIKSIGREPAILGATLAETRRQAEEAIQRLQRERTALQRQGRDDKARERRLAVSAGTNGDRVTRLPHVKDQLRPPPPGWVPRVSRLMALAIRFEQLLPDRVVKDEAELAWLGRVSRARLTQIVNRPTLASDIQEEVFFLPRTERRCDSIGERDLRPIAAATDWRKQRRMWRSPRAGDCL